MRTLYSSMVVTLDGYHEGPNHEFHWPNVDEEFFTFGVKQLNNTDVILFGRATYEGMASYWPTPEAKERAPVIAEHMNSKPKIVFSTTLKSAEWNNTRLVKESVAEEISALMRQPGNDIAIFGSSALTVNLINLGLVDELRVMVNPVLLGNGNPVFAGVHELKLELLRTHVFRSGNVELTYRPLPS